MWYSASVLFRIESKDELPTYCETIVLFQADSAEEAHLLANQWGKEYEDESLESKGKISRWVYEKVLDIWEMFDQEIKSGTEVCTRIWVTPPYIEED